MNEKEKEQLKQDHLAKKHNKKGYYNENCILCVNRKKGLGATTPDTLGVEVKEEVKPDEQIG